MTESIFQRVEYLLKEHGIACQVLRHEPVYTSVEAASVHDTSLASGAKALICKGGDHFIMFVVPADRRLDSHAVRRGKGYPEVGDFIHRSSAPGIACDGSWQCH